jgi:hypothetical protein
MINQCRSQWPRGLRHELSSSARMLRLWVRISLALVCVFILFVLGNDLETGWFPIQGVVPTAYRITKLKKPAGPKIWLQGY